VLNFVIFVMQDFWLQFVFGRFDIIKAVNNHVLNLR